MTRRGPGTIHVTRRQRLPGKPPRPAEEPDDFWTDVLELHDLDDVLRLARSDGWPTAQRKRLVDFLLGNGLPDDIKGPEITRWLTIVDRCRSSMTRETRMAYRAYLHARLNSLPD